MNFLFAECRAIAGCRRSAFGYVLVFAATYFLSAQQTIATEKADPAVNSQPSLDVELVLGLLPSVLNTEDIDAYSRVFTLQSDGHWSDADQFISTITDPLLMGHVRAQRLLHPTDYRARFEELGDWLAVYPDLPQAQQIYRLALKRQPSEADAPNMPVAGYLGGSGQELARKKGPVDEAALRRDPKINKAIKKWLSKIRTLVANDRPTQATRMLTFKIAAFATPLEFDTARWLIARGYFANLKDSEALRYAVPAARRSGKAKPAMYWTAGLAAWRSGRYTIAANHFTALANSEAQNEEIAAGAFWAARAHLELRKPEFHQQSLKIASESSDQFYSLLAKTLLGEAITFDFEDQDLPSNALDQLYTYPGSKRAIALHQVGQPELGERELRKLAARARPNLATSLAALAERLNLPATQMRIAQRLHLLDGRRHDGAMYPIPNWQPLHGFNVDRALLFGLIRAESGFDVRAKSGAGAIGLMQILPNTANATAERYDLEFDGPDSLYAPNVNLTIGQAYVQRLLSLAMIDQDLIKLAMAYNAGLKRLEAWIPKFRTLEADPILYLESIPVAETRGLIRKVLSNIWAYRARMGQDIPSLKMLAEGRPPLYVALDTPGVEIAGTN